MEVCPDMTPTMADFSSLEAKIESVSNRVQAIEDCAKKSDMVIVPISDISSVLAEVSRLKDNISEYKRFVEHLLIQLAVPTEQHKVLVFEDGEMDIICQMLDKLLFPEEYAKEGKRD